MLFKNIVIDLAMHWQLDQNKATVLDGYAYFTITPAATVELQIQCIPPTFFKEGISVMIT